MCTLNELATIIISALIMSRALAMSAVVAKTIPLTNRNTPKNSTIWVRPIKSKTAKTQNRIAVTRSIVPNIFTLIIKMREDKGF